MATLDQIYRAYLADDPNVSQMTYDPFSWNAPHISTATTDTTDTTDTLPATGGITNAYYPPVIGGSVGGAGYVPNYGSPYKGEEEPTWAGDYGIPYSMEFEPTGQGDYDIYGNKINEIDDEGNLLERIGPRFKEFFGGITSAVPNMLNKVMRRPVDATYTYPGDATGFGTRGGLTPEEIQNAQLTEKFGGINELGQDIYGKSIVTTLGGVTYADQVRDYLAKEEDRKKTSQASWTEKYGSLTNKNHLGKTWDEMNKKNIEKEKHYSGLVKTWDEDDDDKEWISKKIDVQKIKKGLKEKKDIVTGTMIGKGPLHGIPTVVDTAANEDINIGPAISTSISVPAHISRGNGNGGAQGTASDQPGGHVGGLGGHGPARWANGGRVQYGNGGIVDLL